MTKVVKSKTKYSLGYNDKKFNFRDNCQDLKCGYLGLFPCRLYS